MLSSKRINRQKLRVVKTDIVVDPNRMLFPIVWKMSAKECNFPVKRNSLKYVSCVLSVSLLVTAFQSYYTCFINLLLLLNIGYLLGSHHFL
jgi:hypothetical protein